MTAGRGLDAYTPSATVQISPRITPRRPKARRQHRRNLALHQRRQPVRREPTACGLARQTRACARQEPRPATVANRAHASGAGTHRPCPSLPCLNVTCNVPARPGYAPRFRICRDRICRTTGQSLHIPLHRNRTQAPHPQPTAIRHCASHHRASPRNAINERSTSTSCSDVRRPTRVSTFDRRTAVSLSTITSLSRSRPEIASWWPGIRIRNKGASMSWLVIGATTTDRVESNRSS